MVAGKSPSKCHTAVFPYMAPKCRTMAPRSFQEPSEPLLGRSWSLLGRSWSLLGRSWAALGSLLAALVAPNSSPDRLPCMSAWFYVFPSFGRLGPLLAALSPLLGRSWAALGRPFAALRPLLAALGRSWAALGALLAALGSLLAALGPKRSVLEGDQGGKVAQTRARAGSTKGRA